MRASHGRETDRPVPGKVLHWVSGRMQTVQFWRFDLKARLHPLHPELSLSDLPLSDLSVPKLAFAHSGIRVV